MRRRLFSCFLVVSTLLFPGAAAFAQEQTVPSKKISLIEVIDRAKALLKDELKRSLAATKEPKVVWSKNVEVDITLAVWNRDTDAITLVNAKKNGQSLKLVTAFAQPITVSRSAGIYSEYRLPPESRSLVAGVIYPVMTEIKVKKKKGYVLNNAVYVPSANDFYTPELLAAGSNYLSFLIQDAFDDMKTRGVRSRSFPDRLLVDVVDPYLIKSVVVTEHTSQRSLVSGDSDHVVGEFLIEFATNKDDAYGLALSHAGAAGLVQFIPSTYNLLVKRLPELGLIPDFKAGMSDHKNAIKAQVALLDINLAAMPQEIRDHYRSNPRSAGELMAAAYNGGATRVRRAYLFWGDDWSDSHQAELDGLQRKAASLKQRIADLKKQATKSKTAKDTKAIKAALAKAQRERDEAVVRIAVLKKANLRAETVGYVAKIRKSYSMFSAGAFATPEAPSGGLPLPPVETAAVSPSEAAVGPGKVCFADGSCMTAGESGT